MLTEAYRRPAATGPARRRAGVHAEADSGPQSRSGVAPAAVTDSGALAVLTAGAGVALLGCGLVGVAVPPDRVPFGASGGWVAAAYAIPLALTVAVSGRLADRIGADRLLRTGLLGLAAASLLGALAPNLTSLLALRGLAGAAAGVVPATALALLLRTAPRRHLGERVGVFSTGAFLLPAAGPLLGGWLTTQVGWRPLLGAVVAVALLAARVSIAVLPRSAAGDRGRLDVAGLAGGGVGLSLALLALAGGPSWGWGSPLTVLLGLGGAAGLAAFAVVELSAEDPLLDLDSVQRSAAAPATLLLAALVACLGAGFVEAPSLLHQAETAGPLPWAALLGGLCTAVALPLGGRLADRLGPRWPAAVGLVLLGYSTYLLRLTGPATAGWWLGSLVVLRGTGMGMAVAPVLTTALAAIAPGCENRSAAAVATAMRVPAGIGAALLVAMTALHRPAPALAALDTAALPSPVAWSPVRAVLLVTAGVSALGVLLALCLPTAPAGVRPRLDLAGLLAALTGSRRRSISLVGLGTRAPSTVSQPARPAAAAARTPRPRKPATPRPRAATTRTPAAPRTRPRAAKAPASAAATPAKAPTRPRPTPARKDAATPVETASKARTRRSATRPATAAPTRRRKEPDPAA